MSSDSLEVVTLMSTTDAEGSVDAESNTDYMTFQGVPLDADEGLIVAPLPGVLALSLFGVGLLFLIVYLGSL